MKANSRYYWDAKNVKSGRRSSTPSQRHDEADKENGGNDDKSRRKQKEVELHPRRQQQSVKRREMVDEVRRKQREPLGQHHNNNNANGDTKELLADKGVEVYAPQLIKKVEPDDALSKDTLPQWFRICGVLFQQAENELTPPPPPAKSGNTPTVSYQQRPMELEENRLEEEEDYEEELFLLSLPHPRDMPTCNGNNDNFHYNNNSNGPPRPPEKQVVWLSNNNNNQQPPSLCPPHPHPHHMYNNEPPGAGAGFLRPIMTSTPIPFQPPPQQQQFPPVMPMLPPNNHHHQFPPPLHNNFPPPHQRGPFPPRFPGGGGGGRREFFHHQRHPHFGMNQHRFSPYPPRGPPLSPHGHGGGGSGGAPFRYWNGNNNNNHHNYGEPRVNYFQPGPGGPPPPPPQFQHPQQEFQYFQPRLPLWRPTPYPGPEEVVAREGRWFDNLSPIPHAVPHEEVEEEEEERNYYERFHWDGKENTSPPHVRSWSFDEGPESEQKNGEEDEEYEPQFVSSPSKQPSGGEVREYIPQQVSRRTGAGGGGGSVSSSGSTPPPAPATKKAVVALPPSAEDQLGEEAEAEQQLKASITTYLNSLNMELVEPAPAAAPQPPLPLHLVRDNCNYVGNYLQIYIYGYSSKRGGGRGRRCSGSSNASTCSTVSSSSTATASTSSSLVAAYGICFREGNQLNCYGLVDGSVEKQTTIRAELLAAQQALQIAKDKIGHRMINLNTTSTFLLENAMGWKRRIEESETGGFLTTQNWFEVKHREEIQKLCDSWSNMTVQWTLIEGDGKKEWAVVELELAKALALQAHI